MISGSAAVNANVYGQQVVPVSISSGWKTLSSVLTGATTVTVAALASPDSLTINTATAFHRNKGLGTNVRIRIIYDDDATAVASGALTYRLWGRATVGSGINDNEWQVLPNRAGDFLVTPTFGFAAADSIVATDYRATMDDLDDATHDCDGCDEFFIQIVGVMALTGGSDSQARLQVKMI